MDFRLKVFIKTAEKLSFTKAAKELFITQPAVTKHITALERQLGYKLFNRKGNHIELTKAGEILLDYAKKIERLYNEMVFDINALNNRFKGRLRIGSSSTMTQYILPEILAKFTSKFKELELSVINGNTQQIENALLNNEIDLGIVEGQSHRSDFKYIRFINDEIVLVANTKNKLTKKGEISLKELRNLPLIIREEGSGTLEVITHYLKQKNIKLNELNIRLRLGSTEGIKNFILHSNSFALLSIHSILKELRRNELAIIEIKGLEIKRHFNFILPAGQQDSLVEIFIEFARNYNF